MRRNRLLAIVRNTIPFVKELMPYVGRDASSCVLFQQLEYWFSKPQYADGFYKFLEAAPDDPHYKEGDSWTEELGLSAKVFKTAFGKIGTAWGSKGEYDKADDKFQGKYFCSYYDRQRHLTYYFRNDNLVDELLDRLVLGEPQQEFTENHHDNIDSLRTPTGVYRDAVWVSAISETTTENTNNNNERSKWKEKSDDMEWQQDENGKWKLEPKPAPRVSIRDLEVDRFAEGLRQRLLESTRVGKNIGKGNDDGDAEDRENLDNLGELGKRDCNFSLEEVTPPHPENEESFTLRSGSNTSLSQNPKFTRLPYKRD